jgi:hypothetical protein
VVRGTTNKRGFVSFFALGLSLFLPLSAPYISRIRDYLRLNLGRYFDLILVLSLSLFGGIFLSFLIKGFKKRKSFYFVGLSMIASAFAFSIFFITNIGLIELVHFLEYGLLTILLSLAFVPQLRGFFSLAASASLAFIVSLADETIQFLVACRVGELRDLNLNLFAILFGTGLTMAVVQLPLPGKTSRRFLRFLGFIITFSLLLLFFFAFLAERGYLVKGEGYLFRSRFPKGQLMELVRERERSWISEKEKVKPELLTQRGSVWEKEDYYLTEAQAHTRIRNEFSDIRDYHSAYLEDRILSDFYYPYLIATDQAWVSDLRASVEKRIIPEDVPYISNAFSHLIVKMNWLPLFFFTLGVIIVMNILLLWILPERLGIGKHKRY